MGCNHVVFKTLTGQVLAVYHNSSNTQLKDVRVQLDADEVVNIPANIEVECNNGLVFELCGNKGTCVRGTFEC